MGFSGTRISPERSGLPSDKTNNKPFVAMQCPIYKESGLNLEEFREDNVFSVSLYRKKQ